MATPKYLPRSFWADSDWPRGGAALDDDELHKLGNVCHYPGRPSAFGVISLESLRNNLRGWYNYHVNTRGWSDIGYQTCVSLTVDGPVVVDLRGIGRVPAAHASASNPRANWHGGATLWTIGNTEAIDPDLQDAYRHFRTNVWLKRWPTATDVTHHRRVPGAQTSCAGNNMDRLVVSGTLRQSPSGEEGDMSEEVVLSALRKFAKEQQSLSGLTADTLPKKANGEIAWNTSLLYLAAYGAMSASPEGRARLVLDFWRYKGTGIDRDAYSFLRDAEDARQAAQQALALVQKQDETLMALLAAHEGADQTAVIDRIEQHHAEVKAAIEEQSRRLDEASAERAAIVDVIEQVGSGELAAERAVELVRERLAAAGAVLGNANEDGG